MVFILYISLLCVRHHFLQAADLGDLGIEDTKDQSDENHTCANRPKQKFDPRGKDRRNVLRKNEYQPGPVEYLF